jgi:hypothetical protein
MCRTCPADRYQRIGAHGEMISSDLHGAEEPIRWTLGWQRQDKVVASPCTEKKKDALIRTFWHRSSPWGSAPCSWTLTLMIRTPPRAAWTFSGAYGSVLGLFGTCGRLQEPQEGQRLAQWIMIMPKQGQRLPLGA